MNKILAIDDQRDNLITITAVLQSYLDDCEILTAQSGKEGILIAKKEGPDVIILDIIMPMMDGYETCQQLKNIEETKNIPVLMLTAIKTDTESRVKGLELGADAFLSKPIDAIELSAQVKVMLRIKKVEDKLRNDKQHLEFLVSERTYNLEESQKKYKSLYDNAPLSYQSLDEEGRFLDVNPTWLNFLGYEADEIIGTNYSDILHPDSKEHFERKFVVFKKRGYVNNVEYKIRHKNGQYLDIMLEGSIGTFPDGSFKQTYCVFQDVTENKIIKKELEESEDYFRSLIENSSDYIAIIDKNGLISNVVGSNDIVLGYDSGEMIGKSLMELVHPDDINNLSLRLKEVINHEHKYDQVKFRFLNKSGHWRYLEGTGKNMLNHPRIRGIVVNFRDITNQTLIEIAKSEIDRKLNTLINNLQGIAYRCAFDKDWTMEYLSSGFETITGYRTIDVIGNKVLSYNSIIVEDDREYVFEEINRAIEKRQSFELSYRIKTVDKKEKHVLEKGVALFSETDEFLAIEGYITDITVLKKTEYALKQSVEINKSITESAGDGIISIDQNGIIISWNQAAEKIFGYSINEMIGHSLDIIIPKDLLSGHISGVERVVNKGRNKLIGQITEINALRSDGKEIPIELSLSKWSVGGKHFFTGITRDITQRNKDKEALVKLSTAVEQSSSVIVITDTKGCIEYINPKFTELSGYTKDEVIGKMSNLLKSGELDSEFYTDLWTTIESGKEWRGEFHNRKKDGQLVWESASISPIFNDKRKITNYIKVSEDITEQKKAAEALKESENRYSKLLETTSEGFWMINKKRETIDINKSLCDMLGYSRDEMMGKTPFEFADFENQEIFTTYLSKAETNQHREYEICLTNKSGDKIPVLFNATSITNAYGEFNGSFAFVTNIFERKRSEQLQKVIYQISNAVNTSYNLQSLLEIIKSELAKIIDTTNFYIALYDKENESLTLPFFADEKDVIEDLPIGKTLTNYVIETKQSLLANRDKILELQKTGFIDTYGSVSEIWLGVPLKFDNEVIGVLAVQSYHNKNAFSDIDQKMLEFVSDQVSLSINRKRSEDNLKLALEKATESDKLKTAFLQNISHEIRTPMNGILGFTSLLGNPDISGDEQRSFIEIIKVSGNRMLNTLNDLMDISKIETGQVKVNIHSISLWKELNDLFMFFKPEAEEKGLSLFFNVKPTDVNIKLESDKDKILAILSNMIKNAIKYTNKGIIEFGFERQDEHIKFYVQDTGMGIPNDRQEAVFERFVQADVEDIKVYEGAGLGLSISKAYVDLLNGEIWLDSRVDEGTTFYFTIPIISKDFDAGASIMDVPNQEVKIIKNKKLKLLIVEDEEVASEFLGIVLAKISDDILYASNGQEALDIMKNHNDIDLILMDMKMPVLDGYKATKMIREFNKEVIIIAQTAYALVGDREKAIEIGCNDYLSKPINGDSLLGLIDSYFE